MGTLGFSTLPHCADSRLAKLGRELGEGAGGLSGTESGWSLGTQLALTCRRRDKLVPYRAPSEGAPARGWNGKQLIEIAGTESSLCFPAAGRQLPMKLTFL